MVVALIAAAVALIAAIVRLTLAVKLMNGYRVEEYATNPLARRMYFLCHAMPFLVAASLVTMAWQTHLWYAIAAASWLALIVVWKTIWMIRMRVSGRYRDLYAKWQWR